MGCGSGSEESGVVEYIYVASSTSATPQRNCGARDASKK